MKKIYLFMMMATLSSAGVLAQCIENGDFEKVVNPWKFRHRALSYTQVGCGMNTSNAAGFTNFGMSTAPNQFTTPYGTIVSQGVDPYLFACSPSVTVPRVYFNKYAIKLNINDGNADVTTMYQPFVATDFISFNYAFSAQNSHQGDPDHQPFFTARITDPSGTIITSYCLKADGNDPIFGTTIEPVNGGQILYTGWHCETLYIPEKFRGKELILEFVVADCGASKDFGTVYLDNVNCKKECSHENGRMMQPGNETESLLSAYPNPVNNVLNLAGAENTQTFIVTDLFGKELIRVENAQKATDLQMDFSNLATGIYLLYADGTNVQKIVKN
jgi:hypothetical protein